jgi:hypothetical protein
MQLVKHNHLLGNVLSSNRTHGVYLRKLLLLLLFLLRRLAVLLWCDNFVIITRASDILT